MCVTISIIALHVKYFDCSFGDLYFRLFFTNLDTALKAMHHLYCFDFRTAVAVV